MSDELDILSEIINNEEDTSLMVFNDKKLTLLQEKHYEGEHWYFKYRIKAHKKIIKTFIQGENLKILDIGVGTGTISKELENYGECTHIDVSEEVISFNEDLKISKGFYPWGITLPENEKYDYICLFNFIEYNDSPRWIIEMTRTKLKPGGKIILTTLAGSSLNDNDKFYGIKRRYKMEEVLKIISDLGCKDTFSTYFENHSLQVQVKDALDKMFDENTPIYWNVIPSNNKELFDYLVDKDLYYLGKQKINQGNQLLFVFEEMNNKEKEELKKKRALNNKKASIIDKAIDSYVKNKEKKEEK